MTRKQLLRLHLTSLRLSLVDKGKDFVNMATPIFVVSGILVGSVRFWTWIMW